nr:hypothetical protein [Tanacetum cinerariifolium]
MDASGGSGRNSPVWLIVDENGAVDMNDMMDNLEERIANLEMVFVYLKNKKMLERQENKLKKETPSSDGRTSEDIVKFEVASKSTSSTFKAKKLSKSEVLRMLELRKTIAEVHIQVHKKIDFLTVLMFYRSASGYLGYLFLFFVFYVDGDEWMMIRVGNCLLDDNGAMDMNGTMDNLEERTSNLEMMFAYLKNKKMLERQENKPKKETPSSDGTTSEDIAEYEVASKSTSSTSKPKKVTAHKVVTQKVQTKAFPVRSPVPINICILGLAAAHTWACTVNMIKILWDPKGRFLIEKGNSNAGYFKIQDLTQKNPLWITPLVSLKKLIINGVFRLTFDLRKSSHYKVVQARGEAEGLNRELKHCKLNMKDHDHPIMTSLEIAHGLHRGRNFLESFDRPINDPILLLMKLPHMLHLEGKFFESCGCLLLVCRDDIGSTEFTIYEMMKGSFVWSVRYLVNIVQLLNPLLEGWSIRTGVWSICLGEEEEDAFVEINLSRKVVKYNLISKTNTEVFDIGSNQMDDDDGDGDDDDDAVLFIPPCEVDPHLYEFISFLASV